MTAINHTLHRGREPRHAGTSGTLGLRTIQAKLILGFALGPLVLLVIGWISYTAITKLIDARALVQHSNRVLLDARDVARSVLEAESGQRGYLLTGDEQYLDPYRKTVATVDGRLERLVRETADSPAQQDRIRRLTALVHTRLGGLKQMIDIRKAQGLAAVSTAITPTEGITYLRQILDLVNEFENAEEALLAERSAALEQLTTFAVRAIIYGALGSILLLGVLGFLFGRSITVPIKGTIAALAAASVQILAGTTEQVAATTEEAAAVKETAATVAQVKQSGDLATRRAEAVADAAAKVTRIAQEGQNAVAEGIRGSEEAKQRMGALAERILALSEQANAIAELNATVNDVAEQSNLLAVNASIEAAKAGEAGRGFAVVAGEVRALAEQSKQATGQVRTILGEIQRATQAAVLAAEQGVKAAEAGVTVTGRSGDAIRELSQTVAAASDAAQQILAASRQQTVGMEQIDLAMRDIEQSSTQTVAATRQVEGAARDLDTLARQLGRLVGDGAAQRTV